MGNCRSHALFERRFAERADQPEKGIQVESIGWRRQHAAFTQRSSARSICRRCGFATGADGKAGHSITVTQSGEIRDALEEAYEIGGPAVIDAKVDPEAAYPDVSDRAPP